ncbi:MAG TPA: hypothetical protein VK846_18690 [Candidatus Limnocylindria bacterium]|nr:hypothetical protein [Candidatus Limnocylindria bacterium]
MKTTKTPAEPELEEIRRIRRQIVEECGRDVKKLHAYYEGLSVERIKAEIKASRPSRKTRR